MSVENEIKIKTTPKTPRNLPIKAGQNPIADPPNGTQNAKFI